MNVNIDKIKGLLGDKFRENEPLASHTTFRIGGPARYFVLTQSSDSLREVLLWAQKNKIPYIIMGGGSNVLVSDNGFDGLIIKIQGGHLSIKGDKIECEAGVALSRALGESLAGGLCGLEWSAGIPGTIGGAIRGNAGAYGSDMSKNIVQVRIFRNGKIKTLSAKDCKFGYRESVFKQTDNKDVILSAIIGLKKADAVEARDKAKKIIKERAPKFVGFSAGCVFKNIEVKAEEVKLFKEKYPDFPDQYVEYCKIPVAWLIDRCGLRGKVIGGAKVSKMHAGIIINTGNATAENVIMLISIIKQQVRDTFGIQLSEEIEYIGF